MGSCSAGGRWFIAIPASRASVVIQFFSLKLQLYLKPFWRMFSSVSEKVILVLFITLGWNLCGLVVVFIVLCTCFMRSSFCLNVCKYFVFRFLMTIG